MLFSFAHVGVFASFVHGATSLFDHTFYQIVCVYHGAFAALHLTVGEFDHAIREVHKALTPFKAETVEEERENLEVIVLFIAHHIDHLVDGIVAETELSSTDVLGHIDRSAVGAEEEFFVQTFFGEISPHRTIFAAIEQTFGETFFYLFLTFEIGVRFVIDFVERHTEGFVGFVKTSIHPFVHLAPKSTHFFVALFPLAEHLASFYHQGYFSFGACFSFFFAYTLSDEFRFELSHFCAIVLVESYVVVAY